MPRLLRSPLTKRRRSRTIPKTRSDERRGHRCFGRRQPRDGRAGCSANGTITESRVSGNGLNRVTLGPDNKLWSTECGAISSIGLIDPTQVGRQNPAVSHFPTPTPGGCPIDITTGPGGDLWSTEFSGSIGRITTAGTITEFPVPGSPPLFGITRGPEGSNLWSALTGHDAVSGVS